VDFSDNFCRARKEQPLPNTETRTPNPEPQTPNPEPQTPNQVLISASSFERCQSGQGGAIHSQDGAPLTVNSGSSFSECDATSDGGAVAVVSGSSVVLESLEFRNCTASSRGGAVFVSGGGTSASASVASCVFSGNIASGLGGGGLYLSSVRHVVGQLECQNNSALRGGGGVLMWDGAFFTEVAKSGVSICDVESDNRALYGNIIASSYKSLALHGVPSAASLAYAGETITVVVTKTDHYNQTIGSDGQTIGDPSSLIQAKTSLDGARSLDSSVQLLGTTIAAMLAGTVSFEFAVKPTFSLVNASSLTTHLRSRPFVYFEGADVEVGGQMLSDVTEISLLQNGEVCPRGYILSLDAAKDDGSQPGQCAVCLAGTYSLHPLAGGSAGADPSCVQCPAGGDCEKGGNQTTFAIGNWTADHFKWALQSCPAGYAPNTGATKDLCIKCKAGTYSLAEGLLHSCLRCPLGGTCDGGDHVDLPDGWMLVDGAWQMDTCSSGFEPTTAKDGCLVCVAGKYSLSAGLNQECKPCPAGGDCIKGGNVTTFAVGNWSVVTNTVDGVLDKRWQLDSCPSGDVFATSSDGCVRCGAGFYSLGARKNTFDSSKTPCLPCPAGGDCLAGGDVVLFSPGENWTVDDNNEYVLLSCPIGYELTSSLKEDECTAPSSNLKPFEPSHRCCFWIGGGGLPAPVP